MRPAILAAAVLLIAACDPFDHDEPFYDPADCGPVRDACAPSCAHLGDVSRFEDARCEDGRQRCPQGYVLVSSCEE